MPRSWAAVAMQTSPCDLAKRCSASTFRRLLGDDLLKLEILFGLQGGEPQSLGKNLRDRDNLS